MREFDVLVQFCLAHLIRDVKFLMTLPGREDQAYGKRVRESLRELFAVIHRREKMTATVFQKALEAARQQVMKAATTRVPSTNHARNLAIDPQKANMT
jgi:tRNA pseudouridine-54 N-methylase